MFPKLTSALCSKAVRENEAQIQEKD